MSRNTLQEPEATICDACRTIPVVHLSLDLDTPVAGWEQALAERGVEIVLDDLGRRSVPRHMLGELLAEQREREARLAAQRVEQAAARKAPVPSNASVPALDDASPYESMVAAGGVTTPAQEFGGGRTPAYQEFLDERLGEGRRQAADERAEREAQARRASVEREGQVSRATRDHIGTVRLVDRRTRVVEVLGPEPLGSRRPTDRELLFERRARPRTC